MRPLFLCNSRLWGGAERYTVSLARGLAARGHTCFVAAPPGTPTFTAAANDDTLTEIPFNLGPKLSRSSALDLALHWRGYRRVMRSFLENVASAFEIDVVHAQFKKEQLLATPAAVDIGLPVVWTEHGQLPRLFALTPPALRRYRRAAEDTKTILCVSDAVRGELAGRGVVNDRLRLCHNGVEAGDPPSLVERARVRAALGLEPHHFVAGCTGRLVRIKGQHDLLHAVSQLVMRMPDLRLVLVGDGPERKPLEELAEQLGIARAVLFLGLRDDARNLLAAFDVFVAPSLTEGMPLAVLEAMAAERPVIATRVGGIPEALADGTAGVLIEPGRATVLASSLERLYRDPRLRAELALAARERVLRHFSVAAMMEATEAAFLEAAGASAPSSDPFARAAAAG
jgi:glycosyltransferase involved in cell wall biosynthesis